MEGGGTTAARVPIVAPRIPTSQHKTHSNTPPRSFLVWNPPAATQNPLLSHDLEAIVRVPPRRYAGIIDAARTMVDEEGYLALYGGFEYEVSGGVTTFRGASANIQSM